MRSKTDKDLLPTLTSDGQKLRITAPLADPRGGSVLISSEDMDPERMRRLLRSFEAEGRLLDETGLLTKW